MQHEAQHEAQLPHPSHSDTYAVFNAASRAFMVKFEQYWSSPRFCLPRFSAATHWLGMPRRLSDTCFTSSYCWPAHTFLVCLASHPVSVCLICLVGTACSAAGVRQMPSKAPELSE